MFQFQLVSLSGKQFDDEVAEVILPTMDGEIGILKGHMPLFSVVTTGAIAVRRQAKDSDSQREFFATNGGVIEVNDNVLRVLVDEADHADDINEAEAQKPSSALRNLSRKLRTKSSLERAQSIVDRQSVRLQVAGLKRRHQKR